MATLDDLAEGAIGYWWLPGGEYQQVPGQLLWSQAAGARLQLLESLTSDPLAAYASSAPVTIYGEIDGTPVTLHNATSTNVTIKTTSFRTRTSESFQATRLFVGAHLSVQDVNSVKEFEVSSNSLSAWQNRSGMSHEVIPDLAGYHRSFSIKGVPLEALEIPINDSIHLQLRHRVAVNVNIVGKNNLSESNTFAFSNAKGLHLDVYRGYANRLRDLASLAAGRLIGTPSVFIKLADPEDTQVNPQSIQLFEWGYESNNEPQESTSQNWAFRLGKGFEATDLTRWLTMNDRTMSHIQRLLSTRHSQGMYLEDKLQNVAAVLQGMGRDLIGNNRAKMQPSFEAVFNFVDESLKTYIPSVSKWKKGLADRRNEISHHDAKATDLELNTSLALYFSSYWLAMFGCLKSLQFPAHVSALLAGNGLAQHEAAFTKSNLQNLPE